MTKKRPKTCVTGAYAKGKSPTGESFEAIFLFKAISEGQVEHILTHESIHMTLDHIGEDSGLLDGLISFPIVLPLSMFIDFWLNMKGVELEGLEASLGFPRRQIQRQFDKKQYVAL